MSVLDNITRKVTDTAKAAAKISSGVVEVTRLNMNISAEEEKIRKLYAEMGRQLYEEYSEGRNIEGRLLEKCMKIDEIIANIDEMREKILEIKNVKACPNCGTVLDMDMEYCHKCGRKQEVPEPRAAVNQEENEEKQEGNT
jgi:hypothetical protein